MTRAAGVMKCTDLFTYNILVCTKLLSPDTIHRLKIYLNTFVTVDLFQTPLWEVTALSTAPSRI